MTARTPATNAKPRDESQGFDLPLTVASLRHVTVTHAGLVCRFRVDPRLGVIHPSIGYTDESIELFLACGLEKRQARLDGEEFLEVFSVLFEDAVAMVRDGRTRTGRPWRRCSGCRHSGPAPRNQHYCE